ncbi:MAG: 30S ribosomal protein S3 [Candidatus Nealsonbacteria bacterium]|nr:30S ribosomal protein S3 [Candidatus Nealsonbacteria bacterium]
MAHKTHPKALRIKGIDDWESKGFYGKRFPLALEEDFFIRRFLTQKISEAGVDSVKIERFPGKINILVKSARPGLIIGRGGSGAEELKKELRNKLAALQKRQNKGAGKISEIRIEIQEVRNPWTSAPLVGQAVAKQILRRLPFRRVLKQTLDNIMEGQEIKGAKIQVAGRLDGAEIARREWLKRGRLPRQTLRADIDYAETQAFCPYGTIGIKVWLYKGEKFD